MDPDICLLNSRRWEVGGQGLRALKLPPDHFEGICPIALPEGVARELMWWGEQYPPRNPHLRVLLRMSTPWEVSPVHCYTPQPRTAPGR